MDRPAPLHKRVREHEATGQFVRYGLIGCLNFAITLAVFTALGHSIPASAVAFVVSATLSFFLNKKWAFKDTGTDVVRQYVLFAAFTCVGLVLFTGTEWLLRIPLKPYGVMGHYIALVGAVPVAVIWNFTAYRRWTFRSAPRTVAPGGSAGA